MYFLLGIAFLALAKGKHSLQGYKTPKPFDLTDIDRCVAYDIDVVESWTTHVDVRGKRVLEVGPGSDLGIGLYLLSKGAASYTAFDKFPLAHAVPKEFYNRFHELYGTGFPPLPNLHYVVREDFDLSQAVEPGTADLVLSNAAFEHVDDVPQLAKHLKTAVVPGGKICAHIDLRTHSRWIREHDAGNIYRYPRWLYRLFYFPGQPNRVTPQHYRDAFSAAGWKDVSVTLDRTGWTATLLGRA
jgi:SAM-dependent methyltransferase